MLPVVVKQKYTGEEREGQRDRGAEGERRGEGEKGRGGGKGREEAGRHRGEIGR